jgi:hypothetical protein
MKAKLFSLGLLVIAGVPACAATCGSYTPVAAGCARTVFLGWGAAGLGTQSTITLLTSPSASGPVSYAITKLNSSKGTSYTGFFGVIASVNGGAQATFTAATFTASTIPAGAGGQITVLKTCFDATCTLPPPAAFTGPYLFNMFSVMMTITGASGADLDLTPLPLLTIQFLDSNGLVTFQEQEQAVDVTAIKTTSGATLDEGATPAGRYLYTGAAVNLPFTSFSVTNPSTTASVTASIAISDATGNVVKTVPLPALPPLSAAGYLLIGRDPADLIGLLPSSTVLPAGADGIFHGTYSVVNSSGPVIFLSQQFYGDSMLNSFILQ